MSTGLFALIASLSREELIERVRGDEGPPCVSTSTPISAFLGLYDVAGLSGLAVDDVEGEEL
jgi:hypothetical protein